MKRLIGTTLLMTVTMICAAIQFLPGGATKAAGVGDDRLRATLDKIGWKYEVTKDGDFKVVLDVKDGRTQLAWIGSGTQKVGGMEIRSIVSPGHVSKGPLEATVANRLLMDSSGRRLGSWEVVKSQDNHVALFTSKIYADSSPDDLKMAIGVTVFSADEMEKSLSQEDKF